jgi:hypothetical protein
VLDEKQTQFIEAAKKHAKQGGYLFEHIRRDILYLIDIIEELDKCHVTDTDWKKRMEQGT